MASGVYTKVKGFKPFAAMGSLFRLLRYLIMTLDCGIIYIERERYNMKKFIYLVHLYCHELSGYGVGVKVETNERLEENVESFYKFPNVIEAGSDMLKSHNKEMKKKRYSEEEISQQKWDISDVEYLGCQKDSLKIEAELERLTHEMTSAMHRAWKANTMSEENEHMKVYEELEQEVNDIRKTLYE